jgi:hypothetical protein
VTVTPLARLDLSAPKAVIDRVRQVVAPSLVRVACGALLVPSFSAQLGHRPELVTGGMELRVDAPSFVKQG